MSDITKLASKGDGLAEILHGLISDPVIKTYLQETDAMKGYLHQDTKDFTIRWAKKALDEWDDEIGVLQKEGLYGPFGGDEDTIYEVEANEHNED